MADARSGPAKSRWDWVPFRRRPADEPRKSRREELLTAALGMSLGTAATVFPWYVFLHQEDFGPPVMAFGGNTGQASAPGAMDAAPARIGLPMTVENLPKTGLDPFATGTLPIPGIGSPGEIDIAHQSYPMEAPPYRMVHATLGRAMIADDQGLFVVQPGSKLPDSSLVRAIEKRGGEWVLVTTDDRVLKVAP